MKDHVFAFVALMVFALYRILPAIQGSPVFSIDAWPLIADSKMLLQDAHASFFPCQHQVSCYFATWPSLGVIAAQFASVTGIPLFYIAPAIVIATSTVEFLSILFISYHLTSRYWPAALFLAADAPANLFYSGFKQEMYAMPLVILSAGLVIKKLRQLNFKDVIALTVLSLGVIFGHHYSSYVLLGCMAGAGVYILLKPHQHVGRFFIWLIGLLVLISLYYTSQFNYISGVSGYNLSFIITLLSYDVVIALVAFRVLDRRKDIIRFPWSVSLISVAGVLLIPLLSKYLYVPIDGSLILEIVFLLSLLPAISLGISLSVTSDKIRTSFLIFWLVAPMSLGIFAVFDGNPVLAYRGYVAATLPSGLLFSVAVVWLTNSWPRISRLTGLAMILLVSFSIVSGLYAEAQPIYSPRNIFNGSTWFYPLGELEAVSDILNLFSENASVYTDLPTLSYSYMLDHQPVLSAIPQQFSSERFILLQKSDNNEFYFTGSYAELGVNLSSLTHRSIVFRGNAYSLYA